MIIAYNARKVKDIISFLHQIIPETDGISIPIQKSRYKVQPKIFNQIRFWNKIEF